ncbi:cyclic nucleotide-regulated ABC bacteriocin/lantibiotic exporter [Rivularia sp. IAM M-261]|nr:cyclic nucleotide-regulated ABC bacteriocin/lantibiotic exporter [Calothrix sp. PCC 7716]GJD20612.1 cyclic nucleotide-regulated ABC bacteriocin/lantibiotic exporter [Rivularia sp. IAM M-261]
MRFHEELSLIIPKVLGESLTQKELQSCLQASQILELPLATQFWQLRDAERGIYIVLAGRVRLLDDLENLITTLSEGASFGEATLFNEDEFSSYVARASHNLRVCYLSLETLQPLMTQYPEVRDKLYKQAEIWDLILLCRQNSNFPNSPSLAPGMLEALSLFERLDITASETKQVFTDCNMLMIRVGHLQHSNGTSQTPGKICTNPKQGYWLIEQPTTVYALKNSDYQTALEHCYELAQFGAPDDKPVFSQQKPRKRRSAAANIIETESVRDTSSLHQKVIPFPQSYHSTQQKPKKSRPYFPSPKVAMGHWWGRLTRQYPFYAQHSASDCGAACLVMIGNYWGKRFSINRLRDMTNANRSGASLRAVANVAESLGFATRPVKATLDKLAEQPLPAIAHWEGKHFIVVYEITKKRVIVGDPAVGQRILTPKEFQKDWTGYALLLQPTTALKNAKDDSTGLWKFFELVKPHYKVLFEIFIASVLMQIFGLITPVFTQLLLDRVLVQRSVSTLNAIGLGMILFGLFRIAMNAVRTYLLDHTATRVSLALVIGFIKHTFRLPLSYFESRYVGDIVSRIQENQKIQAFLTGETLSIMLDLLSFFVYLGVMLSYSWKMTLFVLLTVPPFFILALASTSILRRISREIFNAGAEENSYLIESLTGIRTIRSLAIEQTVRWRWEELLNNVVKKSFSAEVLGIRLSVISGVIETFVSTGIMWFGAWQVINGELTLGQLVAFNMLIGNVLGPLQRFSVLWNHFQEIFISVERLNDVLEAEPEEDLQNKPRKSLGRLKGKIGFHNVTFRYHKESDTNVLENLNFEIKPEQIVALVGRSGSGKTTLGKLILGLYPATDGKVTIDGYDVNHISLKSLRSQVGVVDQDTFLFGGTIRENIAIAHPEASLEEIVKAASLAGADEFIQKQPLGYETQIGEGGGMLSGGQRQRLAIARALLGNPRLILLDEATSHLDAESERIIQNNFKTILKGRTSIIIAHRLSTVRNADLILVLDHGVLVESGTHDELIAKKGHYYYLNQQQLAQAG